MADSWDFKHSDFDQVSTDPHGVSRLGDESRHKEMLNTMRNLQASGFKVVHLHGNDFSPPYKKNGYSIPSALEVSLDAMVDAMDSCLVDETRDPLDQTNRRKVRDGHDLPLAHLPE